MLENDSKGLEYSTVVDEQHHGALVTIAAALGITASVEILLVRLLVRWPWKSLFRLDDAVIVFATVRRNLPRVL